MMTETQKLSDRLVIELRIEAPPARVFDALTDPTQVPQWWGDPSMYQTTAAEVDLRVGGRYRFSGLNADGSPFEVAGEYRTVERPHRLSYTWEPGWDPDMQKVPTLVEITLKPVDRATQLTVVHSLGGYAEQMGGYNEGWERVLSWLKRYAEG
jgi:uncharacterized protein YndB with AHSA1/START domain